MSGRTSVQVIEHRMFTRLLKTCSQTLAGSPSAPLRFVIFPGAGVAGRWCLLNWSRLPTSIDAFTIGVGPFRNLAKQLPSYLEVLGVEYAGRASRLQVSAACVLRLCVCGCVRVCNCVLFTLQDRLPSSLDELYADIEKDLLPALQQDNRPFIFFGHRFVQQWYNGTHN